MAKACFLILLISTATQADCTSCGSETAVANQIGEIAENINSLVHRGLAGSPKGVACISSRRTLDRIRKQLQSAASSDRKYNEHRAALAAKSVSAEEAMVRLVYAETLAAHCPKHNAEIAEVVADVIGNRVRKNGGDILGVIYKRNQFASSLHSYKESRLEDFFCPRDAELWRQSQTAVRKALKRPQRLPAKAQNYYFYKHSGRFTPPVWARGRGLKFSGSERLRPCVRAF